MSVTLLPASTQQLSSLSLYVSSDAEFFSVSGGGRVDLRPLGAIRRIFRLLVETHCAAPGRCLSIPELYEAAWSGEQAACNSLGGPRGRVYTVISKLRRMGLASILERSDAGYCIDRRCCVIVEGEAVRAHAAAVGM